MPIPAQSFGALLKTLRVKRGLTQQELADVAGYSQRHISFLELARSHPTRHTALVLAEIVCPVLDERNALLRAAGFADEYPKEPLDGERLQRLRETCQHTLDGFAPFPAILIDANWTVIGVNKAAIAFFG